MVKVLRPKADLLQDRIKTMGRWCGTPIWHSHVPTILVAHEGPFMHPYLGPNMELKGLVARAGTAASMSQGTAWHSCDPRVSLQFGERHHIFLWT